MIVAALEIENYKQYAGSHCIAFPAQGLVAVTGPNGAGKTTLFEAIEWCLYCPRAIPQATIPPHDGVGRTFVRVTLEDPADGKRYCVERQLRSGVSQGEVYLEEEPGQPLVQGTREVTRYVARHLIGLSHAAFVSTFFTKQKELQFFADRSATERRTEVGRLLGLEAVRDAQREIGDGRSAARNLAESLRSEHERRLADRDLFAERASLLQALDEAAARETEAEQRAVKSAAASESARQELEQTRELQARDAELGHVIAELSGEAREAAARREAADEALRRLDARALERAELSQVAGASDHLTLEVAEHEREAERARHLQTLADAQQAAIAENAAIARQLDELVTAHRAAANDLRGWLWTADDVEDVVRAAARLHDAVAALDPVACRARVEGLGAAWRAAEMVREIEQTLAKYERLRDSLARDRDGLLRHGDPAAAVAAASDAMRKARQGEQSQQMALAAARVEREEDERIAGSLRQHAAEAICPTCARPLGPGEVERLADLLGARIEKLREEERNLRERAKAASASVAEAERAEAEARGRLEEVRALDQRLADGQRLIDEVRTRHEEAQASLHQALDAIDATEPPTPAAIEEARLVAERTNQLFSLGGLLARIGTDAQAVRDARAKAEAAMRDIGQVSYDPEGHQRAVSALDQARRAAARIEQIDVELAHRAAHEGQRAREERTLAEIAKRRAMVEAERQALGFDPVTLQGAIRAEQAARQAAHEAREEHASARQAVRDARAVLERLEAERTHLQQLVETADEKAREADELSRMYDEFAEFDRYVARHVGPLLAETTERMLSQVTNGKYDHVQFDENYGIEVFDGDEAFPLSGFSGGERDVVALCARLALSEVVGSAALRPPRFLVLDEVFGSLDSERRAQLLETLGSLADGGHFRQMFIISHIDDVQYSPVMSEAWTVEERVGVSHVVRPPVASLARA